MRRTGAGGLAGALEVVLAAVFAAAFAAVLPRLAQAAVAQEQVHHAAAPQPTPAVGRAATPAWVRPLEVDPAVPVPPGAYQILLADRQTRVGPAGVENFRHYVRRVNDASALAEAGQINIDFDPGYEKLVFHRVLVLRGNQRIDKLDTRKIRVLQRETQLERQMVDGRVTASLVLDDLRPGDRIDWEASVVGANPVFGGRYVDVLWSQFFTAPVGLYQFRLLAPAGREIHARANDPAVEVTSTVHGSERETVFRRRSVPQLSFDERAPASDYLGAQIELSEYADWAEVDQWAQTLFAPAMQPTPALEAQLADLKASAATPAQLLRAALDFVQKDVRYFGTEEGIGSHRPAPADTVLAQRFGDCKDKAALLSALLTREGIEATPVLASLREREAVATRLPSPLAFDHVIVRVVADGAPLYLDPTREAQTGTVAARQAYNLGAGLEVRPGVTAPTPLPSSRDQVQIETVDTFSFPRLAEDGRMESVTIYHGDAAESLRAGLATQPRADVDRLLGAETLRAYPTLTPEGSPEIDSVREDDSVRVTAHYRAADFWSFPEQRLLVGHFSLSRLIEPLRLPDQSPRSRSLEIASPGRYLQKVVYVFGEESPGAPGSRRFDETNGHFDLHLRYETAGARQEAAGELLLKTGLVAPQDWTTYKNELRKIAAHLGGDVQVAAISPAQGTALHARSTELLEDLRTGRVKAATRIQGAARIRLLFLDQELQGGRLSPPLRAQALIARGEQLDHLGQTEAGRDDFRAALEIDPASADAHEALAVNAFLRRADDEARHEVDETLRLNPSNTHIRYTRAWADFFNDRWSQARDELRAILQSPAEVERSYGAIWLYLATQRLGGDGAQAVQGLTPTASAPDWPYPALQYLQGRLDLEAALAASREAGHPSPEHECELYLYAGEKALAEGQPDRARSFLRKSVETGVTEFVEYGMAQRELDRLAAR